MADETLAAYFEGALRREFRKAYPRGIRFGVAEIESRLPQFKEFLLTRYKITLADLPNKTKEELETIARGFVWKMTYGSFPGPFDTFSSIMDQESENIVKAIEAAKAEAFRSQNISPSQVQSSKIDPQIFRDALTNALREKLQSINRFLLEFNVMATTIKCFPSSLEEKNIRPEALDLDTNKIYSAIWDFAKEYHFFNTERQSSFYLTFSNAVFGAVVAALSSAKKKTQETVLISATVGATQDAYSKFLADKIETNIWGVFDKNLKIPAATKMTITNTAVKEFFLFLGVQGKNIAALVEMSQTDLKKLITKHISTTKNAIFKLNKSATWADDFVAAIHDAAKEAEPLKVAAGEDTYASLKIEPELFIEKLKSAIISEFTSIGHSRDHSYTGDLSKVRENGFNLLFSFLSVEGISFSDLAGQDENALKQTLSAFILRARYTITNGFIQSEELERKFLNAVNQAKKDATIVVAVGSPNAAKQIIHSAIKAKNNSGSEVKTGAKSTADNNLKLKN